MANIWEQIGLDLFGDAQGDNFGFTGISLSKDGTILAVGAQGNDDNGIDSGQVRIFENINNTWTQIGSNIVGEYAYDQCGVSVDLSDDGKIVAIGAWHNDDSLNNLPGYERIVIRNGEQVDDYYPNGQVRVYEYINNDWIQIGLDIDGDSTDEWSGHSVSLSANGTFVGIGGQNSNKNSVYEYKNNNWTIVGHYPPAKRGGGYKASSLSSDGTTFAIADDNGGIQGRGLIKTFKKNNGNWVKVGNDIESLTFNERLLGHSIHLSENGSFLAISAPYSEQNKGGLVRVYEFLNNQWIQIGPDIKQTNIATEFGMGLSISADGSLLAIGAPSESQVNNVGSVVWGGSVRLYQNINNAYVHVGNVINGNSAMTNIGYAIDLSGDGSTLAIGSRSNGVRVYSIDITSKSSLSDLEALQYVASNPDLITAFGINIAAATSHYANHGISEGRSLTVFSASLYLAKYSDLSTAFGNNETLALKHYIQNGYAEGRTDSSSSSSSTISSLTALSDFEALNYIASYSDLISVFVIDTSAASSHYVNSGYTEGRAKDNFDEWGYLASNNDLMSTFGSNTTEAIKHYISFGKSEGRSTNIFNAESYLNNYADLKNAFGNDHTLATKHYVESGFYEGRSF